MNDVDPALVADFEDANVHRHADALVERDQRPAIAFDCEFDDRLLEHNRRFHQYLQSRNIEHHYVEFDGSHEWEYWPQTLPMVSWTASELEAMAA